ncbi:hypothetical protein H2203_003883 [Taxawa tesnikishii (nom. ined.)]|nr:hypothetical protein H2203_003883 [Dothideales sp. JES 119]
MSALVQNTATAVFAVPSSDAKGPLESVTGALPSPPEPTATQLETTDLLREAFSFSSLSDKVVYPDGQGLYPGSANAYFCRQNCSLTPSCIVQPASTADVAEAIKTIVAVRDAGHNVQFAVRSGGHMTWGGASNIEAGVTIDLRKLDFVRIHADRERVTIGPGARWGAAYAFLEDEGLAVSGGRVSSVGVGGLTLGGGISFFSPRKGFACDNVITFEMVTAAGEVLTVSQDTHPELWRALKGGSNNFGIVTAFEVHCFEQGPLWMGNYYYKYEKGSALLAAFHELATAGDCYDEYASVILSAAFKADIGSLCVGAVRHTGGDATAVSLKKFRETESTYSDTRMTKLSDTLLDMGSTLEGGACAIFITTTIRANLPLLETLLKLWENARDEVEDIPGLIISLALQPLPPAVTGKASTLGGNSLGLTASDGDLINVLLSVTWDDSSDSERATQAAKSFIANVENESKARGYTTRSST